MAGVQHNFYFRSAKLQPWGAGLVAGRQMDRGGDERFDLESRCAQRVRRRVDLQREVSPRCQTGHPMVNGSLHGDGRRKSIQLEILEPR